MSTNLYQSASFITSAAEIKQLADVADSGYEVAFAGRSNAGKSSSMNTLTSQKNLARTSKTPGRTQLINFFRLDDDRRLVDLPGYGYAKVPLKMQQHWQNFIHHYLEQRECLRGVVIVMDCRHPLQKTDVQLLEWCLHVGLHVHLLLTKADKLSRQQSTKAMFDVKKAVKQYGKDHKNNDNKNNKDNKGAAELISVQCFSALKKTGIDELKAVLNSWFEFGVKAEAEAQEEPR